MRRSFRARSAVSSLRLRLLMAVAICATGAASAFGYLTSTGTGSARASIAKLSPPAYAEAAIKEAGVQVTWRPSTVAAGSYATSYTVARYSAKGKYLANATCGTVLAPGDETPESTLECLDEPGAGSFQYEVTAHYGSWTVSSAPTSSITFYTSSMALESSANPATPNTRITYSATVEVAPAGTPEGMVRFAEGGSAIAGCAEAHLTATTPYRASCEVEYSTPGSHEVTAEYLGDGTHPPSRSAALSEEVVKGEQTITFPELPESQLGESATASATASSGLPVMLSSETAGTCSIEKEEITLEATGTCTIEARQEGDEDWNAATPVSRSFTITNPPDGPLTPLAPASVAAGAGPARLVVSPDGDDVYATNRGEGTVSQYSRDPETGALTALSTSTVTSGSRPEGIAVTPSGDYVYVANLGSNSVSEYSRDATTGALTPLSPATVPAESQPIGITVSPNGDNVYVVESESEEVSAYEIEAGTGQLVALAPVTLGVEANAHGVVASPDGSSVYVSNYGSGTVGMYSAGTEGALTSLGTIGAGTNPHDLAISPDGESLYVADNASRGAVQVFSRNLTSGELTFVASVPSGEYSECVVVSPGGEDVYVTNQVSGTVSQYARAATGGSLTALSPSYVSSGELPEGIAISPDGKSVYVADSGSNSISQYER